MVGTAGFTAGLAISRLELNGLEPERGAVAVTGADRGWLLRLDGDELVVAVSAALARSVFEGVVGSEIECGADLDQEFVRPVKIGDRLSFKVKILDVSSAEEETKLGKGVELPTDIKKFETWEASRGYGSVGYFGWCSISKRMAMYYMTGDDIHAREFVRLAFPDEQATRDIEEIDGKQVEFDPAAPLCIRCASEAESGAG